MKKITLFLLMFAAILVHGQQRFVLFEEFTQASCGPCASQNPAFNALLDQNTTKCIGLKYQTSWPGADPMNAQNPSEVQTRVTYYGVSGVPYTRMDGSVEPTGAAYPGAPANVDQALINTQYAVTSPFSVAVSHTLSNNLDSISISITIQNVSGSTYNSGAAGSMKLHTAIIEEEIQFPVAPGTNGEMDFYGVMRKMLPNANGTTLADSWTAGQSQTFTFDVALPNYIYNYGEVAVIGFIQDNDTKAVLNTDYSEPGQLPANVIDAGIETNIAAPGLCDASFIPSFTIKNEGPATLTSATVSYTVNGSPGATANWTGTLAAGATTTYDFPAQNIAGGSDIEAEISSPNGGADYNNMNNMAFDFLAVLDPTPQAWTRVYGFESNNIGEFPSDMIVEAPSGRAFIVDNQISATVTWNLGGFATTANSFRFDFYTIPAGDITRITTGKINLNGTNNNKLYFDHAHAQYQSEADMLEVFVSNDCGATWNSVWSKSGAQLATAGAMSARLYPDATQWASNAVDLSAYDGDEVVVQFVATSDFGNALYLDNIAVRPVALDIEEDITESMVSTYPNPASSQFTIDMSIENNVDVTYEVVNQVGAVVAVGEFNSAEKHNVDVSNLASGIYTIRLDVENNMINKRISVTK